MKIFLSFLLALSCFFVEAQNNPTYVLRSNGSYTPVDPHLGTTLSFKIPVLSDTTAALAAAKIDSMGIIFKERFTKNVWIRDTLMTGGHGHIWTLLGSGSGGGGDSAFVWGFGTGTLANQTDLQNALNAKQATIALGTTAQYFRGNLSLATFPTLLSQFTNDLDFVDSVIVTASITGNGNGSALQLVGDNASPGANKFYGTNGGSAKGWYSLPTGTGTVTSIATTSPILGGTITATGTISLDTTIIHTTNFYNTVWVKYSDTSTMLSKYLRRSDTTAMLSPYARKNFISANSPIGYNNSTGVITADTSKLATITALSDSINILDTVKLLAYGSSGHAAMFSAGHDSLGLKLFNATSGVILVQNTDSSITYKSDTTLLATLSYVNSHAGSGTVTSIATASGILGGTITATGTLKADTSLLATQFDNGLKVNISDTSTMLSKYLRKSDTTAMLVPYARSIAVVKYTDTSSILTPYLHKFDTTAMLSTYTRKNFISGSAPISYSSSTGVISADTSTALTGLATKAFALANGGGSTVIVPSVQMRNELVVTVTATGTAEGNSITAGVGTSIIDSGYVKRVGRFLGVTFTNNAVSNSTIRDIISRQFSNAAATKVSTMTTVMGGINNLREDNVNFRQNAITEGMRVLIANQFFDSVFAISTSKFTKNGTWSNFTTANITSKSLAKSLGNPMKSSTANDSLNFVWYDDNMVIGTYAWQASNNLGTFDVSIDGVDKGIFSGQDKCTNFTSQINTYDFRQPIVFIFTGLGYGLHNVRIKLISAKETDFDYVAKLMKVQNCAPIVISHITKCTPAGYAAGSSFDSDLAQDSANANIDTVCNYFRQRGYPVATVHVNSFLNMSNSGTTDGLHPGDAGNLMIAQAFESVMSNGGSTAIVTPTTNGLMSSAMLLRLDSTVTMVNDSIGRTAAHGDSLLFASATIDTMYSKWIADTAVTSGGVLITKTISNAGILKSFRIDTTLMATQSYVLAHGGGGSGTVTSIATGNGLTGGTITTTGTIKMDTTTALTGGTTLYQAGLRVKYTDTASMLSTYVRSITAMKYTDTSSTLAPYLRKFDTTAMLLPYVRSAVPIFSALTANGGILFTNGSGAVQQNSNYTFDATNIGTLLVSNSLGSTLNISAGLIMKDSTAAATGVQQLSPSIGWHGKGWKSTSTAASQDVAFYANVLPIQGTTAPTGGWQLSSSINYATPNSVFEVDNLGNIVVTDSAFSHLAHIGNTSTNGKDYLYVAANSGGAVLGKNPATGLNGVTSTGGTYISFWEGNTANNVGLNFGTHNIERARFNDPGHFLIGLTTDTSALVQIAAGTTTVAPLKLTAGVNLTSPVNGALEFSGTHFYITLGGSRLQLDNQGTVTSIVAGSGLTGGTITSSGTITVDTSLIATQYDISKFASGNFGPTLTGITNVASSTAGICTYNRVGNVVTVFGTIIVTATSAATATAIDMTLPIASTIGSSGAVNGVSTTQFAIVGSGIVLGDNSNNKAQLQYTSPTSGAVTFFFTYQYQTP